MKERWSTWRKCIGRCIRRFCIRTYLMLCWLPNCAYCNGAQTAFCCASDMDALFLLYRIVPLVTMWEKERAMNICEGCNAGLLGVMRNDYVHLSHLHCGENQGVSKKKRIVAERIWQTDRCFGPGGLQMGARRVLSRHYIFAAPGPDIGLPNGWFFPAKPQTVWAFGWQIVLWHLKYEKHYVGDV